MCNINVYYLVPEATSGAKALLYQSDQIIQVNLIIYNLVIKV